MADGDSGNDPLLDLAEGVRLVQAGRLSQAEKVFRQVLSRYPRLPEAWNHLAGLAFEKKRFDYAIKLIEKAIQLAPHNPLFPANLGGVYLAINRPVAAEEAFKKSLALDPDQPEIHYLSGRLYRSQGRLTEAELALRQAIKCQADLATAWVELGHVLNNRHLLGQADQAYRTALGMDSAQAEAFLGLGVNLLAQGRADEAIVALRAAHRLKPDAAEAHSSLVAALNYSPDSSQAEIFAESRAFDRTQARPLTRTIQPHANRPDPDRVLNVGYVSPDFCNHPVSHFFEPLLMAHDRQRFEIFCYSNLANPDLTTTRLKGLSDHWREIQGIGDEEVAETIRRDGIDILVDLAGHTRGNRLLVFARKPAPIQVTWLGYPHTTGLTAMDYRLTDPVADPPGPSDAFHSEKLIRLPHGFLCYQPPLEVPEVLVPPVSTSGWVTFGSFNNTAKVTETVLAVWTRLLEQVDRSRLVLKFRTLYCPDLKERFARFFAVRGISPDRVIILDHLPSLADHLACYGQLDIALDTFPYNGTTTTCEALFMGVPVITFRGTTHAGRVGASLLTAIGHPELIAVDKDDYLEKAVALADNIPALERYRQTLRAKFRSSPLSDAGRFARDLEEVYHQMWSRWCRR